MPPKVKIEKERILLTAMEMVRESGIKALNARAIAKQLDCSTQPLFSCYKNMEQLKDAVINEVGAIYQKRIVEAMASGKYPPYKASGMAYINFARDEKEFFKLLFMDNAMKEQEDESFESVINAICLATGLSENEAKKMHLLMWSFVHGIATMVCTGYLEWTEEQISWALTREYDGLKFAFGVEK